MGRTMRKWLAVGALALVAACGGGMDAPSGGGTGGAGAVDTGGSGGGSEPGQGGSGGGGSASSTGTGGAAQVQGTGGATQIHGTGGMLGTGGASPGTGGATVSYAPCSTYGVTVSGETRYSAYISATKTNWAYVASSAPSGMSACLQCYLPTGTPACAPPDSGDGVCVPSMTDCTIWIVGGSGMAP